MAITLNKEYGALCEEITAANEYLTPESSARPLIYDISRNWRELADATPFVCDKDRRYSEQEVAAAKVVISSICYLQRIGCPDVERLLKDTIERLAGKSR